MRRPRLTPKIIRGLAEVHAQASADFESMSHDESRPRDELAAMEAALEYIEALVQWAQKEERS